MSLPFKRVISLFAAPALAGLLGCLPLLSQAAELKEIRIAVPDLSAGTQHSGGGVVDVLRQQQIFEKAFADQGIKIQWNFFKGAGPVINEAFANGQVDLAYLGTWRRSSVNPMAWIPACSAPRPVGSSTTWGWSRVPGSRPWKTSRASAWRCSVAPPPSFRSMPPWPAGG